MSEAKPTVLLVTIDTLRADHLSCYGYHRVTSPHLDVLAQTATIYQQAVTNGSYTKPAFPPILSSTYASMYGGPFQEVSAHRPMLARVLKEAGYRTAAFVSNPLLGKAAGYDDGFDVFRELTPSHHAGKWTSMRGMQRVLRSTFAQDILQLLHIDGRPSPIYVDAETVTLPACEWLTSTGDDPAFLWVHYMDTHWPYYRHPCLLSSSERAQAWRDNLMMHRAYHAKYPGDSEMIRIVDLYDNAIQSVDMQIGWLLSTLDRCKGTGNTLTIVLSDHGEEFFEHGCWQHGASSRMYDELLRVPLLIRYPGQKARMIVPDQIALLNVAPTVIDLAGLPKDPVMEGKSLYPPGSHSDETVITEMVAPNWYCAAVRTPTCKYIYDERLPKTGELYDLVNDPKEQNNLIYTMPSEALALQDAMSIHLQRVRSLSDRGSGGEWSMNEEISDRMRNLGYID